MKRMIYSIRVGMTLIELVLAIAIVGIVITSVVTVLDLGLNSWRSYDEKAELLQNGRIAMRRIIEELKYAEAQSITYSASPSILQFDTIYLTDSNQNITYTLTADSLYRSIDSGTQRKIADSIDTFAITSPVIGLYEIELELSDGNNALDLKNLAYPRN